ncbi:MAG TPA: rod shape-determining protein MreC [Acidimicrobiales bacterium]|nr:rod shape-determining protein MreC [Acidimicrobiales bacterium]
MAIYRRSSRSRFTLLLLVLTSVTVLTLDQRGDGARILDSVKSGARDLFAPVQAATDAALAPISDVVNGVTGYGDLRDENARLRDELDTLRGQTLKAADQERELKALLEQQGLDDAGDIAGVAARVVSTSPSSFELTIVIDRGTSDGITEGMPVVTGAGLVGRVADASKARSTVVMLTDRSFDVGVRATSSDDVAVAAGRGRGRPLTVDLFDTKTTIQKGEVIVTSGLQQSRFPPGIPVGRVIEARFTPGDLSQTVTAEPVVDLDRLTFVRVLLWRQH